MLWASSERYCSSGLTSRYTNPPFLFRLIGAIFKAALWLISIPVMIFGHREY